jgi:hypothetical protein
VGGHIAISMAPLCGGIGKDEAIFTGGEIFGFLTTFALFSDSMAGAAIKLAAFIVHEKTLIPFFYTCTNHFDHILSLKNCLNLKRVYMPINDSDVK